MENFSSDYTALFLVAEKVTASGNSNVFQSQLRSIFDSSKDRTSQQFFEPFWKDLDFDNFRASFP